MNCEIENCEHRATQEAIIMFNHKPGGMFYCHPAPVRICAKHAEHAQVSTFIGPEAFRVIQNEAPRKGQPMPIMEHCRVKIRPMPKQGGKTRKEIGIELDRGRRKRNKLTINE